MSKEAIETFLKTVHQDSDLREKVEALQKEAAQQGSVAGMAERLSTLSATAGSTISAAQWQAFLEERSSEALDDGELGTIAGGWFIPPIQIRQTF